MRVINKCCTRLLLHKQINITRVINTFSQKKKNQSQYYNK